MIQIDRPDRPVALAHLSQESACVQVKLGLSQFLLNLAQLQCCFRTFVCQVIVCSLQLLMIDGELLVTVLHSSQLHSTIQVVSSYQISWYAFWYFYCFRHLRAQLLYDSLLLLLLMLQSSPGTPNFDTTGAHDL